MKKALFKRKFLKLATKYLPQSNESVYSYRYEMPIRSEDTAFIEKVAIVIDAELEKTDVAFILDTLQETLKKDQKFKLSKYGIVSWHDAKLELYKLCRVAHITDTYNKINAVSNVSAEISNLSEIAVSLYKLVGLMLIITHKNKLADSDISRFPFTKKSMVIYPDYNASDNYEKIKNEICLGLDILPLEANELPTLTE